MSFDKTGNLIASDVNMFSCLGIPAEVIAQAGIERVTDCEAREKYGIVGSGDMSGIVFPYFDPITGQRRTARLRRDNPEIEGGKLRNKYVSAYGDRRRLFSSPGSAELLGDPNVPIVLVEAEKSVLALACWAMRMRRKILPLGMGGCWGWRGRIGRVENSNGQRVDETGPLPELACASGGRKVYVLLDNNVNHNPSVRQARKALVLQLTAQGADVRIADLPAKENVNGPDDYVGRVGDAAMAAVLDGAVAADADRASNASGNQAGKLLLSAADAELFHTLDNEAYATVVVNGHKETWRIESRMFRLWLRRQYHARFGSSPRAQALQDALNTLEGGALFGGPECEVFTRVAEIGDRIYLDLANESWSVIEIDPSGWKLLAESPVKFRRAEGMRPLQIPLPGGCLDDLKTFVNIVDENDWRLIVSIVLQWVCPHGPYAILVLNGEHGSAKSTTAKVLRELIDPSSASHSGPPTDTRDVVIAARNQWIVSLDNLSHIPDWLSDSLCRLATGGGMRTRRLFTDAEETILEVQRPVILNGIEQLSSRPDLMDRSVVISLPKVPSYCDEKDFWRKFRAARPRLLGVILDTIVRALALLPHVQLPSKPRMADFAIWGTAIEQALGWGNGAFMTAYEHNQNSANDSVLEGSAVGTALEKLLAAPGAFMGTASSLLKQLELHVDEREKSQRTWPRNPVALRNALKRLVPNLRKVGIEVQLGERDKTRARNRIVRVSRVPSEPSVPSAEHANQQFGEPPSADSSLFADTKPSTSCARNSLRIKPLDSADGADASAGLPNTSQPETPDYIQEDI